MMKPFSIQSMHGLGDNIFIRPFIRAQAAVRPVYLATPWPELFDDIPNVHFNYVLSNLRTQNKNVKRQAEKGRNWAGLLQGGERKVLRYGDLEIKRFQSITRTIEAQLPLPGGQTYKFDLPDAMRPRFKTPTAIIRPVTIRKEWTNTARNPRPEYIAEIAQRLMETHDVVLIADLKDGEEWLDGPLPPHHRAYLNGELPVEALLRLVAEASVVVGGVGWIVPAAIAAGTKAFIISGGQGAHNAPSVITDPRMDLSRIAFATPDNFCLCNQMRHDCNKQISDINDQWERFANEAR